MKKTFILLFVFFLVANSLFAQPVDAPQEGKLRDRCIQYIQNRLDLTKAESSKFKPLFARYFKEFAQTHRMYKDDKLIYRQKIIELRLRYRDEFKQILNEQQANRVYDYEDEFRRQALQIIRENKRNQSNNGAALFSH